MYFKLERKDTSFDKILFLKLPFIEKSNKLLFSVHLNEIQNKEELKWEDFCESFFMVSSTIEWVPLYILCAGIKSPNLRDKFSQNVFILKRFLLEMNENQCLL